MLHSIGKRGRGDDDVSSLLLACHGRIRQFLGVARVLSTTTDAPPHAVADAAASVMTYFERALPLHAADEELTITPRLQGQTAELDAALRQMANEHDEHEDMVRALVGLMSTVAGAPQTLPGLAEELEALTTRLTAALEAHLAAEEANIFPALLRLPQQELDLIRDEMRARRAPR